MNAYFALDRLHDLTAATTEPMNWPRIFAYALFILAADTAVSTVGADHLSDHSVVTYIAVEFIVSGAVSAYIYYLFSKGRHSHAYLNAIAVFALAALLGYVALYLIAGALHLSWPLFPLQEMVSFGWLAIGTELGIRSRPSKKLAYVCASRQPQGSL